MYRDAATGFDERDRAVGAILIGEVLIASCERAQVIGDSRGAEAWRAIRDAHDDFPEIWRSLDRARHVLASRGANVTGYDELRPRVRTRLATSSDDTEAVRVDPVALDDARRATSELKLAVPGTDWAAIERRTSGLVHAPLLMHRRNRTLVAAIAVLVALFTIAATMWVSALTPQSKPDRHAAMRRELAGIAQQRRVKIVQLQRTVGDRCELVMARELAKQLVMDGRGPDARTFAADYALRCGDDPVVSRWANAPAPQH